MHNVSRYVDTEWKRWFCFVNFIAILAFDGVALSFPVPLLLVKITIVFSFHAPATSVVDNL